MFYSMDMKMYSKDVYADILHITKLSLGNPLKYDLIISFFNDADPFYNSQFIKAEIGFIV